MLKLHVTSLFFKSLSSCCAAALCAALVLTACTGNGGSANSDGDIYTPGIGGVGATLVTLIQLYRAAVRLPAGRVLPPVRLQPKTS